MSHDQSELKPYSCPTSHFETTPTAKTDVIYKMFQKNITDNMLFLGIEKMYTHSTTKDLSDNIKKQVDEYWTRRHTRIKFVQLQ